MVLMIFFIIIIWNCPRITITCFYCICDVKYEYGIGKPVCPRVENHSVLSLGILHLIKQHHQTIAKTGRITRQKCALTICVSYIQIQKLGTPSSIAVLHIRDLHSLLSRQHWQWSSILGKRCHWCDFTPCPAQSPLPASVSWPRPPRGRKVGSTGGWFVVVFFLSESFPVFVSGSSCQLQKWEASPVPVLWAVSAFVLVSFVLNLLHLHITIPDLAWAVSYCTLCRTEVHDCYIKLLCQLLLHQQKHLNFVANLFLCHYL